MYRILIVDNDMLSQEALEAMIAGYEQFEIVDKVTTGEKAVKVCRSCAVDLVFVEMQLPGISGAETEKEKTKKKRPERIGWNPHEITASSEPDTPGS